MRPFFWALGLGSAVSGSAGSYVVHFSSAAEGHSDAAAFSRRLSVLGRHFQCHVPGRVEQAASDAYVAQLRSAGLFGHCIRGVSEDQQPLAATGGSYCETIHCGQAYELCIGVRFSINGQRAVHQPQLERGGLRSGFEQQFVGAELQAKLNCTCYQGPPERQPGEGMPKACDLGQHVWTPNEAGEDMAMVVGFMADDERVLLRWIQRGSPKTSFQMQRKLLRSAEDGRSCSERNARRPWVFNVAVAPSGTGSFQAQLQAAACCGGTGGDVTRTVLKLLETLEGTCHYVQNGWWTYELCWPYHVRRLHLQTTSDSDATVFRIIDFGEGSSQRTILSGATRVEVASMGGVIGFFGTDVQLRRSLAGKRQPRAAGPGSWPQEVVVPLESGDDCRIAANQWLISVHGLHPGTPVQLEVRGVGGPFNPATLDVVEGYLASASDNVDGCEAFDQRFEGAILVVKRGNCFFQVKASNAEEAGAVGLVIYNDQRPPVESMEGVEELLPPRIPSIFVHAEKGMELLRVLSSRALVSKVDDEHLSLAEPITGNVVFRCSEDFQRQRMCQVGDTVDVKLWVKSTSSSKGFAPPSFAATEQELHELAVLQAQVDSSSLRMLRGQVLKTFNESLVVQWLGEGEQDIILGTVPGMQLHQEPPVTVPLRAAFRDGVPCTASRHVWVEKLLEPYACNAEFVVHVASLCAVPQLAPQKPQQQQDIHCEMQQEREQTKQG